MHESYFNEVEAFAQWMLGDEGNNALHSAQRKELALPDSENVKFFLADTERLSMCGPLGDGNRSKVTYYAELARKHELQAPIPSGEALEALHSARPYEALHHNDKH